MKSEVPAEAAAAAAQRKAENLKGPLAPPPPPADAEPMDTGKSFPAEVDVLGKAGSEFSPLCAASPSPGDNNNDDPHHHLRPLRDAERERDRSLPGRKKRKGQQQAGPSDCPALKGPVPTPPQLNPRVGPALDGRSEDEDERHPESSLSDCASSHSSSLRFGDSDTLSTDEEGDTDVARRDRQGGAAQQGSHTHTSHTHAHTRSQAPPTSVPHQPIGRTRSSRRWSRLEPEAVLVKRQCLSAGRRSAHAHTHRKRLVKASSSGGGVGGMQRTNKQKERLLLQRKKQRESFKRRKYALLQSTSSSSEEPSSASSASSSEHDDDDVYLDVSSTQSSAANASAGKHTHRHTHPHMRCHNSSRPVKIYLHWW